MRYRPIILGALVIALASGCAANTEIAELKRLRRQVERLSQGSAQRQRDVENLNNRIFLLEDKVDTSRVAISRRAPLRLPVVRIRPGSPAYAVAAQTSLAPQAPGGNPSMGSPPLPNSTGRYRPAGSYRPAPSGHARRSFPSGPATVQAPDGGGRSLVSREAVEYAGAASAKSVGPRPMLRLLGSIRQGADHQLGNGAAPNIPAQSPRRRGAKNPLPQVPTVSERLAVVAIPKRKVAVAMAKAPADPEAMRAYMEALALYRKGKQKRALAAFTSFMKRYSKHAYADNALYWLGECHYDLQDFREALKVFRGVVQRYPSGNKAPAALLKMGFSYMRLDEKLNAKTVLAQVVDVFPRTRVARLASQTLSKLR